MAKPPSKPLLVFDGDCHFCGLWIRRWRQLTGEAVEYLPAQDPRVAEQFPEIPRARLDTAVQLIATDGGVYSGAEAVFRALAEIPAWQWLWRGYENFPVFASCAEWAYRLVADHRPAFSTLTRWCWGRHVERPSYFLVRWLFLRSLGAVYFFAFLSLWTQIAGLIGPHGILPADQYMSAAQQQCDQRGLGLERFHLLPTLCWFNASDTFLQCQCAAGVGLSVLLLAGLAPAPCLAVLWLLWLSLVVVGRDFLGFQWDSLLLETGWLAIFLAPLQLVPRPAREAPPSRLFVWLLRLLLFKLMFSSGCVKLLSGDPNWRNLTALTFHYQTQPLPPWTAWCANQLPFWFQKFSCAATLGIELGAPFLIFAPRRLRFLGAALLVGLQALILLTGNYAYFNWLSLALCLLLFDDFLLEKIVPRKLGRLFPRHDEGRRNEHSPALPNRAGGSPALGFPVSGRAMDWLRHSTQGVQMSRTSRAVVANALTPTGRSTVRFPVQPQPGLPARSDAKPRGTIRTLISEFGTRPRHHFPTSLRSTVITRFVATTDALTPAGPFVAANRGSLIHVTGTSGHSISNHLRFSTSRVHSLSAGSTIAFGLRLSLADSPEPPTESSSRCPPVWADGVTDWSFASRCSPPGDVAPMQLRSAIGLQCRPSQGLSPCCSHALSDALEQAFQPAGSGDFLVASSGAGNQTVGTRPSPRWPFPLLAVVAAVVLAASGFMLAITLGVRSPWLSPFGWVAEQLAPFRSVNNYGLFAVMTTQRNEIILEGSNDGTNWLAYEFKYKPGDLRRRPAFIAPCQPRLDWQMWFAALGSYQQNPWFVNFCVRLLQGSPDVLALLAKNPFPNQPPRFIRAQFYDYRFTGSADRHSTGAWWRREYIGEYLPPISLRE